MKIAKIEDGTITVGDYRELFPSTSFPPSGPSAEWMTENNCMNVNMFKPYDSRNEKLVPVDPYVEGEWVYTVAVSPKNQQEKDADTASKAAQVRTERNKLLSSCDWTQLSDAPVDTQAWAAYRQSLRDISDQPGFPWTVEWPKDPNWVEPTVV